MNAKSLATLFATTVLAATFASSFAPQADAGPFGMKALFCMNDEAREQIRQLQIMEQHYENQIANEIKGIAADQDALKAAEAALQNDVNLIGKGANAWPQNFNPQTDIDVQVKQINYLDRLIPQEESDLHANEAELKLIQAWLRADSLLGPCPEPPAPVGRLPGGTLTSDGGDLLNGPPVTPPVLADPNLPPPDDGVVEPTQPRSGFVDPPPPASTPEKPGLWDRFWKGCRSFFECQTEEDEKEDHKQALDQARQQRASQTKQDVKTQTSFATPTHTATPVEDVRGQTAFAGPTRAASPVEDARGQTASGAATRAATSVENVKGQTEFAAPTHATSGASHATTARSSVVDAVKSHGFGQTTASRLAGSETRGVTHKGVTGFDGGHGLMRLSKFGGLAGGLAGLGELLIR